jgi:hypothetical protein
MRDYARQAIAMNVQVPDGMVLIQGADARRLASFTLINAQKTANVLAARRVMDLAAAPSPTSEDSHE